MSSNQGLVSGAGTLPGENTKRVGGKKMGEGRGKAKSKNMPPPHLKYKTKAFKRPDMSGSTKKIEKIRPSMVLKDMSSENSTLLDTLEDTTKDDTNTKNDDNDMMMGSEISIHEDGPAAPTSSLSSVTDNKTLIDLIDMAQHTCQISSTVPVGEPIFQAYPQIIKFNNFKAYTTIPQQIYFRNNDSVPRRIKLSYPDSPYFEISGMQSAVKGKELKDSKVAAGMEVSFVITFKPQEVKDYVIDLVVCTEREKFVVPVRAYGDRPLLNMTDAVNFGTVPVKSSNIKPIIVQNLGSLGTSFKLTTDSTEFKVFPNTAYIEAGGNTTIDVEFSPSKNIKFSTDMKVEYSGGPTMYVALEGDAENVNVGLSETAIVLDPTYISLSTSKAIKIFNKI